MKKTWTLFLISLPLATAYAADNPCGVNCTRKIAQEEIAQGQQANPFELPCTAEDPRCAAFITDAGTQGNIGTGGDNSNTNADALCQAEGEARIPGSIWRAWLSTSTNNACAYAVQANTTYFRQGTVDSLVKLVEVGANTCPGGDAYENLIDGGFVGGGNPGNENPYAWTGSDKNGQFDSLENSCQDWTVTTGSALRAQGAYPNDWNGVGTATCIASIRLACFQQHP